MVCHFLKTETGPERSAGVKVLALHIADLYLTLCTTYGYPELIVVSLHPGISLEKCQCHTWHGPQAPSKWEKTKIVPHVCILFLFYNVVLSQYAYFPTQVIQTQDLAKVTIRIEFQKTIIHRILFLSVQVVFTWSHGTNV